MVAELPKAVDHSALGTVKGLCPRFVSFPSLNESLAVPVLPRELSTGERLPLSASGVKGERDEGCNLLTTQPPAQQQDEGGALAASPAALISQPVRQTL